MTSFQPSEDSKVQSITYRLGLDEIQTPDLYFENIDNGETLTQASLLVPYKYVGEQEILAHAVLARSQGKIKLPRVDIDKVYAAVAEIRTGKFQYKSSYDVEYENASDVESEVIEEAEEVKELPEEEQAP